ncbi:TPA: imidazole glycerol phosphate synthase subunit HisF [Vibrio vulnificus]|nr:imidazole glycerol phosphate synthase subunit HisF [Vibrio vulnificus]HDY7458355.1 imidazole glycerol phosphate synthase subunit HisF [Vibrio vulnificus]HDY7620392.1 imidazole glycerol phosphate synthase subunit HisF [Vibrio vulnificus]HDY8052235.1 imidazole glycerol phosphate synthase subunit HisF [Vibrio vulnificus]HDY8056902.1 imidazole glycerol phosphate synthase subunit HisF [Vibrio vulnificus]
MLRNRLIFTLIYNNGSFMQSRNFRLQRVGDINWLEKNYKFQNISFSLDELVVIDASKEKKDIEKFSFTVSRLVENVFIPVAAGGGIRKLEDAELLFQSGADKVVLNSALFTNPELAIEIINRYGSQSLIASLDYKIIEGEIVVHIHDGTTAIQTSIEDYLFHLEQLGVGEIIFNSIDKDGTGFGYDLEYVEKYAKSVNMPFIIMGGAGNEHHLTSGLSIEGVSGVATANLFNFIGNGLPNARKFMLNQGLNLARWL